MSFQGFVERCWCLCQMLVKRKNPCVVRHVWDFYPEERSELLRTVERHADALAKLGILKGHHKGLKFPRLYTVDFPPKTTWTAGSPQKNHLFLLEEYHHLPNLGFFGFQNVDFHGCNWGEILLKERYLTTVIHHWGDPSIFTSWNVEHIDAEGIGLKLFNLDSHIGWCDTDLGSKFPKDKVV